MAFKIHSGICANKSCGRKGIIATKDGYCRRCRYEKNQAKKQNRHKPTATKLSATEKKKVFSSLQKKFRKPTGEKSVFLSIWNNREHICTNCKTPLGNEPLAHFFSHIISKKRRPDLRLQESNIELLCVECHYSYQFQGKEKFEKRKVLNG